MVVVDPSDPALDESQAHHLAAVLRLRPGEVVVATDGSGRWSLCRFDGAGRVELDGPEGTDPRPTPELTVAFAPVKGERPERTVAQLTELGVDRVVILDAVRSVVRWRDGRADAVLARLRRVAAEAACQSRRAWLPEVAGVASLAALAGAVPGNGRVALADPAGVPLSGGVTTLAVGPEGGWAHEELRLGLEEVRLGPHVLRAGTAAVSAGALLVARRAGTLS